MPLLVPPGPEWWTSGRGGTLAPWAQAVVWAMVKVSDMQDLELQLVPLYDYA
jgi:hypothetical protein